LRDVLGVGVLKLRLATPAVDLPAIALDKVLPGALINRLLTETTQQRGARVGVRRALHRSFPFWARKQKEAFASLRISVEFNRFQAL
jgi:hypothetical protein